MKTQTKVTTEFLGHESDSPREHSEATKIILKHRTVCFQFEFTSSQQPMLKFAPALPKNYYSRKGHTLHSIGRKMFHFWRTINNWIHKTAFLKRKYYINQRSWTKLQGMVELLYKQIFKSLQSISYNQRWALMRSRRTAIQQLRHHSVAEVGAIIQHSVE